MSEPVKAKEEFYSLRGGQFYRVTLLHSPVDIPTGTLARMVMNQGVKITKLFDAALVGGKSGTVMGASIGANSAQFTVPIPSIILRSRFHLTAEKVLVPDFACRLVATTVPQQNLEWVPPLDMSIYLMVVISPDGHMLYVENCFLFAMDKDLRTYRLPTSNVYEDCRVCMGEFASMGTSHVDCVSKAVAQFKASTWNADLANRGGAKSAENGHNMFRFKPNELEGFEQLPPAMPWPTLCTKVSNEFINQNVALPQRS